MVQVPIVDVINKVGSVYKTVLLVSMRVSELNNGAPRLVEGSPLEKLSNIALREIVSGKVSYKIKAA